MTPTPEITPESLGEAMDQAERDRREESATRRLLQAERTRSARLEKLVDTLTVLDGIAVSPAEWAQPGQSKGGHRAVANLLLSDLHLDEIVDPGQMRGSNAYNREIAGLRLQRCAEQTIKIARDYVSGVSYDGIYIWANGDLLSGVIHDELERTNEGHGIADSIDHWVDPLASFLLCLADYFKKVHVVSTVGNHGRAYKKPPAKDAVRSSYDWLTMRCIWRELRTDTRFTWNIPESKDVVESVYSTTFLAQHGDDFRGGDQIAGAIRPVLFGEGRAALRETRIPGGQPFDIMLVSHFHQYNPLRRVIMNGSIVGYNEYARDRLKAPWEPPIQAFWLTTPENGVTGQYPIFCMDQKAEGW